jgi:DNA repair exonuclease SbcCD ATPase subunit
LFSCNNYENKPSQEELIIDSLKIELKSKDNSIKKLEDNIQDSDSLSNQYALYLNKIKSNLEQINQSENYLNKVKSNPEMFEKDTLEIINAVQQMLNKINENEKMINKLNNDLQGASIKNNKYINEINSLTEQVALSNKEVFYLKEELSSLNESFNAMFEKYNLQKIKIKELNTALNKVAFVVGTKSELLKNGVLTKEGGIIGLGKSRKLSNELNTEYFTVTSKSDFSNLILGVKSLKIITSHPDDSYKLLMNENDSDSKENIESLIVINKNDFWKNSKYLVIEVK